MSTSTGFPDARTGPARLLRDGLADLAAPPTAADLAALGAPPDGTDGGEDGRPGSPAAASPLPPVYLCGAATSSMDVARVLAARGDLPAWGSVLAARQTAGKGQLGRAWVSPLGNVYAALRLPAVPPFTGTAAAPAAGGLVAEALIRVGAAVRMKWPNDIVAFISPAGPAAGESEPASWRKIGGILLEERKGIVLAGIGINLRTAPPDSALRAEHALAAASLAEVPRAGVPGPGLPGPDVSGSAPRLQRGKEAARAAPLPRFGEGAALPSPFALWRRLANLMLLQYGSWACGGSWRELAERHLAFRGRRVLIVDGDAAEGGPAPDCGPATGRHEGLLDGLDESGGLRLSRSVPKEGLRCDVFLCGSLQLPRTDDAPPSRGPGKS